MVLRNLARYQTMKHVSCAHHPQEPLRTSSSELEMCSDQVWFKRCMSVFWPFGPECMICLFPVGQVRLAPENMSSLFVSGQLLRPSPGSGSLGKDEPPVSMFSSQTRNFGMPWGLCTWSHRLHRQLIGITWVRSHQKGSLVR